MLCWSVFKDFLVKSVFFCLFVCFSLPSPNHLGRKPRCYDLIGCFVGGCLRGSVLQRCGGFLGGGWGVGRGCAGERVSECVEGMWAGLGGRRNGWLVDLRARSGETKVQRACRQTLRSHLFRGRSQLDDLVFGGLADDVLFSPEEEKKRREKQRGLNIYHRLKVFCFPTTTAQLFIWGPAGHIGPPGDQNLAHQLVY